MAIVYREEKGTPLTYQEGDGNFKALDNRVYIGTVVPTATDDSSKGFYIGCEWRIQGTNLEAYICLDDTAGAAVWEPKSSGALTPTAKYNLLDPDYGDTPSGWAIKRTNSIGTEPYGWSPGTLDFSFYTGVTTSIPEANVTLVDTSNNGMEDYNSAPFVMTLYKTVSTAKGLEVKGLDVYALSDRTTTASSDVPTPFEITACDIQVHNDFSDGSKVPVAYYAGGGGK